MVALASEAQARGRPREQDAQASARAQANTPRAFECRLGSAAPWAEDTKPLEGRRREATALSMAWKAGERFLVTASSENVFGSIAEEQAEHPAEAPRHLKAHPSRARRPSTAFR